MLRLVNHDNLFGLQLRELGWLLRQSLVILEGSFALQQRRRVAPSLGALS